MTNGHIDKAALVANTPVKQLAIIVARGLFAAAVPLVLFSALAGFAAGLAVQVFRFVTSF